MIGVSDSKESKGTFLTSEVTLFQTHGAGTKGNTCVFWNFPKGVDVVTFRTYTEPGEGIIGDEFILSDGSRKGFGSNSGEMIEFSFLPGTTRFAGFKSVTEIDSSGRPYIKSLGLVTLIQDQSECYDEEATSF